MITLQAGERVYELSTSEDTSILLGRSNSDTSQPQQSVLDLVEVGADDLGVSRRHALIRGGPGTFFVIDLESTNGTYLNGRRLQPRNQHLLVSGDVLRLGALEVRVQIS
jgi:pSer/pThr/pTyr-binding forkhead associated (FHA) protein